jgi:hypothetical protein
MTCLAVAASLAHADGDKTVTRVLLEKDAQIAVQKADQELAKTNPAPVVTTAAPTAEQREARGTPKTVAIFGVDGSKAGLPVTLRSYVKWGGQVYPAKVGGNVRGYKVVSISEAGTKLSKGKQTLTAERADDESVLLEEPPVQRASVANGGGPLPAHAHAPGTATAMPSQPPVMPAPFPGAGGNGVAPVMPPTPPVPAAPAAVAQG